MGSAIAERENMRIESPNAEQVADAQPLGESPSAEQVTDSKPPSWPPRTDLVIPETTSPTDIASEQAAMEQQALAEQQLTDADGTAAPAVVAGSAEDVPSLPKAGVATQMPAPSEESSESADSLFDADEKPSLADAADTGSVATVPSSQSAESPAAAPIPVEIPPVAPSDAAFAATWTVWLEGKPDCPDAEESNRLASGPVHNYRAQVLRRLGAEVLGQGVPLVQCCPVGMLAACNSEHPEKALRTGDAILEVSDACAAPVQPTGTVILVARYPDYLDITLSRHGRALGIKFKRSTHDGLGELVITDMLKDGALGVHNSAGCCWQLAQCRSQGLRHNSS